MTPPTPSRTHSHLFDIPEILQAITSHLDPASLVSCLQVSHHWFLTCAPLLWSQISARDWLHFSAGSNNEGKWGPAPLLANNNKSSPSPSLSLYKASQPSNSYAKLVRSLEYHASLMRQRHWIAPLPLSRCRHPVVIPATLPGKSTKDPSGKSLFCQEHNNTPAQQHSVLESALAHAPPSDTCFLRQNKPNESVPPHQQETAQDGQVTLCAAKGMTSILRNCSNIQTLRLHAECYGNGEQGMPIETLCMIGSLTYLQSLELYLNNIVFPALEGDSGVVGGDTVARSRVATREVCIQELIRPCAQLKHLVLRGTAFKFLLMVTPTQSELAKANSAVAFVLPRIQELTLDIPGLSEPELTCWLHQCPNLESLSLPGGLAWEWSDDFLCTMAETCPHLEAFSINGSSFGSLAMSEERLTALVRAFSTSGQLKTLAARACHFGDSTLQALQEFAPGLEHLDISLTRSPGLSTAGLLSYLCHAGAKNLKCIEADGVWIQSHDLRDFDFQQESHDQEPQGWTCKDTLERLVIGFSSPDRTTTNPVPTTHLPSAIESEASRPLSWYMYKHLSTLTRLERLQFSQTCLDLSPEGGIHQLQSLKQLRTFGIESCGYAALTQDQVRWMASTTHWPRLETIYINPPGASCERQIQSWLSEMGRQDSLQVLSLQRQKLQQHYSNMVSPW
ncbi:MAG: hypothetical protein BYD32DRAFT_419289 [Podila humilis]|nr:MAG: hypothetical protein BYD32DRAFT_419289 [Podila humilis]